MDSNWKLFHLEVRENIDQLVKGTEHYFSYYRDVSSVTVIARSEEEARKICTECDDIDSSQWVYADSKYSTCTEVPMIEKTRVVMYQQCTG